MEGLTSLLEKLSVEDIEKLRALISLGQESSPPERITLKTFEEEYKLYIKQNKSSSYYDSVILSFKHLEKYFSQSNGCPGNQKILNTITFKEVENIITYIQQKVKHNVKQQNRTGEGYRVYVRTLKAAFNKAVEWGYVKENYFLKVKLPKKQKIHPAFINKDQLTEIIKKIENENIRDIVITGFYTGMRLNELMNLNWRNINTNTGIITVGDEEFTTKGRSQRYIPICDEVMEVLERNKKKIFGTNTLNILKVNDNKAAYKYVFYKSNGIRFTGDHISKCFKEACRAAGLDKSLHFHSLRHSFASNLAQQGISLYTIKELLGHSSITTTEIYSHLNVDSLREAISVLDDPNNKCISSIEQNFKCHLTKIAFEKNAKGQTSYQKIGDKQKKITPGLKIILPKKINGT